MFKRALRLTIAKKCMSSTNTSQPRKSTKGIAD